MIDEISVYDRLESPLLGALIHTVAVTSNVAAAAATAARVFDAPADSPASFVDVQRLNVPIELELAIHNWPLSPESVFGFASNHRLIDACFRPQAVIDAQGDHAQHLYRPIQDCAAVVDCFCMTFPICDPAWAMVAYLRCAQQPPFSETDMSTLARLKPRVAGLVHEAFRREVHSRLAAPPGFPPAAMPHRSPTDIAARLSRTEQLILPYLRSAATEREIAQAIHRSPHTVHVHVRSIYRKLGIASRQQLQDMFGE